MAADVERDLREGRLRSRRRLQYEHVCAGVEHFECAGIDGLFLPGLERDLQRASKNRLIGLHERGRIVVRAFRRMRLGGRDEYELETNWIGIGLQLDLDRAISRAARIVQNGSVG